MKRFSLRAALSALVAAIKEDFSIRNLGSFPSGIILAIVLMSSLMTSIVLMHGDLPNSGAWREVHMLVASAIIEASNFVININELLVGEGMINKVLQVLGIVPLDLIRVFTLLMAVHYMLHLPAVARNIRARINKAKGFVRKCLEGLGGVVELGVKVAVPVLFYALFVGGHVAHEIFNHGAVA